MGPQSTTQTGAAPQVSGWRFKTAMVLFVVSLLGMPILVPLFAMLGFSAAFMASFTAVGAVVAELMLIAGAAIAGKQGFAEIKRIVFQFLKRYGPPQGVGKPRYIIGLIMFCVPLLLGFLSPYLEHFEAAQYIPADFADFIPGRAENVFTFALVFDIMLIASLFVLGGDFWDKLRSLFIHDARVTFPPQPATEAQGQGVASPT